MGLSLTDSEFYRCMAQRFAEKQVCFSHMENNMLKWCVWEKTTEDKNSLPTVQLEVFYCHPTFLPALEQIVSNLANNYDKEKINEIFVLVAGKEFGYLNEILEPKKETAK